MDIITICLKGGSVVSAFCDNDYVQPLPDGRNIHYFESNGLIVMSIYDDYIEKVKHSKV